MEHGAAAPAWVMIAYLVSLHVRPNAGDDAS